MGDKINITLNERTEQGKKVARLRKEGLVPGVVYGQGFSPILVQSPYGELEKVIHAAGRHTPVHTTIGNKKRITMIKNVDYEPVKAQIRHVSFHAVKANEVVTAEVPIRLLGEGESEAEKAGLVVLQAIDQVVVKAKPADLPDVLEVSTAGLVSTEDKLTLSDITLASGVEYADNEQDLDLVLANVYEPAALQAANESAGGDAEDESEVESENGTDTPQEGEQDTESKPGGKDQDEPKQSNVNANK